MNIYLVVAALCCASVVSTVNAQDRRRPLYRAAMVDMLERELEHKYQRQDEAENAADENVAKKELYQRATEDNIQQLSKRQNGGPPHVFFFLIDDLGFNDVSWHNSDVKTPNIDALSNNGIILDWNYAQSVCSPSRGALMSGKLPFHTGMQHNVIQYSTPECADLKEEFLPQKLQKVGYETYMLGKWHLGFCNWKCTPTSRGFDHFYGFYQGYIDHYTHMTGNPGKLGYDFRDDENVDAASNGTYATYLLTDRTNKWIREHDPSKPGFFYISHALVHTPLQTEKYKNAFANLPVSDGRKTFLGMLAELDDSIGATVDAVKAAGLYDNSVFIFQSDNGGEFHAGSNIPLRSAKTTVYEGGQRVPAFISSPLIRNGGRKENGLFHISDWHSTILSLAGAPIDSDLDGLDQTNFLFNGGSSSRDEVIYNIDNQFPQLFGQAAIRDERYKLILGYPGLYDGWEQDGNLDLTHVTDLFGLNRKRSGYSFDFGAIAAYVKKSGGVVQLFDLQNDPEERKNIANANPAVVQRLTSRLDELKKEVQTPDAAASTSSPEGDASNFGGIWTPGWC